MEGSFYRAVVNPFSAAERLDLASQLVRSFLLSRNGDQACDRLVLTLKPTVLPNVLNVDARTR